jgi:hypothetical protein
MMTDSNLEPFGCEDEPSPIEPSNGTQNSTQLSKISLPHEAGSTAGLEASETIDINPETKITACQSLPEPAAIENDIALEPEAKVHRDGGMDSRQFPALPASLGFSGPKASHYALQNNSNSGHVYNIIHSGEAIRFHQGDPYKGFDFDMGISYDDEQRLSAFQSACESREVYTSKKRPVVSLQSDSCTCLADRCLATYAAGPPRGIQEIHTGRGRGSAVVFGTNRSVVHRSG